MSTIDKAILGEKKELKKARQDRKKNKKAKKTNSYIGIKRFFAVMFLLRFNRND